MTAWKSSWIEMNTQNIWFEIILFVIFFYT